MYIIYILEKTEFYKNMKFEDELFLNNLKII